MFANPNTSPQKKMKLSTEDGVEQDEEDQEDCYEREMKKAMQESLREVTGELEEVGTNESLEDKEKEETVECPICQREIKVKGALEQHNILLNNHIDQCLKGGECSSSPPSKQSAILTNTTKKRKAGPLDSFVVKRRV
jgi:hypothetical protein